MHSLGALFSLRFIFLDDCIAYEHGTATLLHWPAERRVPKCLGLRLVSWLWRFM